jgi:predicted helicase
MAWPVMRHMAGRPNLALITSRMTKGEAFEHVLVSNTLSEVILLSSKTSNNAFAFPLHLHSTDSDLQFGAQTNLAPRFLGALARALRLAEKESTGLPRGLSPEDIFHYFYAVLYSPGYRSRYAEFLKIDFPRLPLPGNLAVFRALTQLGCELVGLHLLESPRLDKLTSEFICQRNPEVEKISWSHDTVWVDKAQTTGFQGVREGVWNFHIGGYQVCEKWLKDRKGRTLSKDDIAHYQKIIVALSETIRLMAEIDHVIDAHGGWPGAFQTTSTA